MVVFVPSMPMKLDRLRTAGSSRIARFSSSCRAAISSNEASCGASEIPRITPVSWTGKNPLGTTRYRCTVAASVARATINVIIWRRSTQVSVLPYSWITLSKAFSDARYSQPCCDG